MPIDDLLAYFDYWNGTQDDPVPNLQFDDQGAFGSYRGLRLYSVFQPIFAPGSLRPVAHEALLRARSLDGREIPPAEAFKVAVTADDAVYFDRLCRMVHAINFFTQSGAKGDLYLNVSGRHLTSVGAGHGKTFEKLLGYCGLKPTQIVLEILESNVGDLKHLRTAVDGYRERGFRVAIDDFGCQYSNFDRLWRLTPDIVKLDRSLIVETVINPLARRILPKVIDIIQDLSALVVVEGIETYEQCAIALDAGADLVQGYYFARPAAEVQLAETLDQAFADAAQDAFA